MSSIQTEEGARMLAAKKLKILQFPLPHPQWTPELVGKMFCVCVNGTPGSHSTYVIVPPEQYKGNFLFILDVKRFH